MSTEQMAQQTAAGRTLFTKAPTGWQIVGPAANIEVGGYVTVTKADGTTTEVWITKVTVNGILPNGTAYRVAEFTKIMSEQPRAARCTHSDTDNNGRCYSCGAYSRAADAGRAF